MGMNLPPVQFDGRVKLIEYKIQFRWSFRPTGNFRFFNVAHGDNKFTNCFCLITDNNGLASESRIFCFKVAAVSECSASYPHKVFTEV